MTVVLGDIMRYCVCKVLKRKALQPACVCKVNLRHQLMNCNKKDDYGFW